MLFTIALSTIENTLHEQVIAYRKRILDLVDESMMEPTWDGERWHAPCDHYVFDGISYHGGAYLHDPIDGPSSSSSDKYRFTISVEIKEALRQLLDGFRIDCTFGKEFDDKCYAYVEGRASKINTLKKLIPENEKFLIEAGDGVETGSTWETTLGKIKNRYFEFDSWIISIDENLEKKIMNWYLDDSKKTKKPVRVTVGYQYRSYMVVADSAKTSDEDVVLKSQLIARLNQVNREIAELEAQLAN